MSPDDPQKTAQQTFALIVGIEEYDMGAEWTLEGCIASALTFLAWLQQSHVPLDHVFLHLSPQNSHHAARPADLNSVQASILTLKEQQGDVLFIYWAGHGYAKPEQKEVQRLYVANSRSLRNTLGFDSVLAFLGSDPIGCQRQLAFVDACADTTADRSFELTPYRFVEDQITIVAEQYAYFPCRIGEAAPYQKGGLFSKQLFDWTVPRTNAWKLFI